jgi:hypothetical protein
MFVGAMCAVGTLNVNAFGFPALNAKIAVFFLAAMWLAINHIDSRARDYPLVRIKYAPAALLRRCWRQCLDRAAILPRPQGRCHHLLLRQPVLGRQPDAGGRGLALEAAAGDVAVLRQPRRGDRAGGLALATAAAGAHCRLCAGGGERAGLRRDHRRHPVLCLALHLRAPAPPLPFCILKPEYGYQGYWLYLPLFTATAAGLAAGAVQPFARIDSLREIVPGFSRNLAAIAANGYALTALSLR